MNQVQRERVLSDKVICKALFAHNGSPFPTTLFAVKMKKDPAPKKNVNVNLQLPSSRASNTKTQQEERSDLI